MERPRHARSIQRPFLLLPVRLLDAGYLYAILRLCPYSLLPSLAISAVVWNDHRYGGALGSLGG